MIFDIILYVAVFLLSVCVLFVYLILTQKNRHRKKSHKVKIAREYVFKKYIDQENVDVPLSKKFFFEALIDIDEQIHLEPSVREKMMAEIANSRFIKKQINQLNAWSVYRRKIAVFYIGRLRTQAAYALLFKRFKRETNESVKLRIVAELRYGLTQIMLQDIIESLVNSSDRYHQRLCTLLGSNYKRIYKNFYQYKDDQRYHIVLGLIRISSFHADAFLINYMQKTLYWLINSKPFSPITNETFIKKILMNLLEHTPETLANKECLHHENTLVKEYAILSLSYHPKKSCVETLLNTIDGTNLDKARINALSKIVLKERSYLFDIIDVFKSAAPFKQRVLVQVLAERVDYILLTKDKLDESVMNTILQRMLELKIIEPLIDFLNTNHNHKLEEYLINQLKLYNTSDHKLINELRQYLKPQVLRKLGLQSLTLKETIKDKPPFEKQKAFWIIRWIILSFFIFPVVFLMRMNLRLLNMTFSDILKTFILEVNIYLIFYFVLANLIYTTLFFLALRASRHQVNLAKTKKHSLLFTNRLLPGISIIAPAYNESLNIIESITSLLNLKYPNYEVIVVNDGSKDETLHKLIHHFKLERVHQAVHVKIKTKDVRGVYKTFAIPNLIVVDKHNGGKADALNVGINIAKHPFVCGIDADSILEGDALLKLASSMLDDTKPFIALGGNIYPANGFTFDQGNVISRSIPKENLCRFQTIEYLRAFTNGRIGWSELNSLMIISGAFGLFQKEALIETKGYLTSSGDYHKDTVGEDMELVVRLSKNALEKKQPYRVSYVYNAYCYTELPSDLKTLLKQRNRWQRGLIDILSYHRKLTLRPKYKQVGFVGYPYFFTFEFLGPFLEAQGYAMLMIASILGLLSQTIILGILTASIIFGVVISLSSLYMSEREVTMMSKKDMVSLIFYAIFENFGYRQIISLHRIISTVGALKETGAWGAQKRKGFKTS